MRVTLAALLLAVAGLSAVSCSGPDDEVTHGRWGGHNAELSVTPTGALATFKCGASGSIDDVLILDASSSFDVPGVYLAPAVNAGTQPARYVGSVSGSDMTLAVTVAGQATSTFQLRLGTEPTFDVCNF